MLEQTTRFHRAATAPTDLQSDGVAANLAQIRQNFLDRLSERCLEIEALMNAIDASGAHRHLVDGIVQRAHKTAGVAPTHGFETLGALAIKVEAALTAPDVASNWGEIKSLLDAFLDEIERILDEV